MSKQANTTKPTETPKTTVYRVPVALVPTMEVPLFARTDAPYMVRLDLTRLNSETVRAIFYHGLRQKIADAAAASNGTPRDERIAAAEKAAEKIECNNMGSRGESWTEEQLMGISMFVAKKHSGKIPKGGKSAVWQEIEDMDASRREKFDAAVRAALSEDEAW